MSKNRMVCACDCTIVSQRIAPHSCHFLATAIQGQSGEREGGQAGIFCYTDLFFPTNFKNHWYLTVVNLTDFTIRTYDSLREWLTEQERIHCTQSIINFVDQSYRTYKHLCPNMVPPPQEIQNWRVFECLVPQQKESE